MMKKFFFLLFIPGILLLTTSCRKETTTWYSDWVVPLVHDTLDLEDLTNDSTLSIQNGFYQLDLSRKVASVKPSDYVVIPDTSIEQKFAISISSLNIPPGTSFVNNNEDHVFDLGEIQLKNARVKKGMIFLEVFNPVATKTFFKIELPSVSLDGVPLMKTLEVPAGTIQNPSSNTLELDLSGYFIEMTGSTGTAYNSLPSKLTVNSDPSGQTIALTSSDSTRFIINMKGIELDYARGYFGNYKVTDSYSFVSGFLKNKLSGAIDIPAIDLQLTVKNGIKVSGNTKLVSLINTNAETGKSVSLSQAQIGTPFLIQTATGSWSTLLPSTKTIEFTGLNSNLETWIENLGETTDINYEIELNPWGNTSGGWDEFFPNSALDVELKAQMPLDIGLNKLTVEDTFAISFQPNDSKLQLERGTLSLKVENGFPFQGEITLFFLDENNQLIKKIGGLDPILSSVYGSANPNGLMISRSVLDIPLSVGFLEQLDKVKKIVTRIKLNSPDSLTNFSEVVSIPEKAFLKLNLIASFKLENRIGE